MKKLLFIVFTLLFSNLIFSQDCAEIVKYCEKNLKVNGKTQFISDGQIYSSFLDREKTQFKTTLFGGTTYRIAVSGGNENNFVIFTLKDLKGNIIFCNKKFNNAPYWDFVIPATIPVIIEAELDVDKKTSGCIVMLIGYKK